MDRIAISIGFIEIYWYAIFIVIGIIVAYIVARTIAKERGVNLKDFEDLIFIGLILSIIGTRLYYVIFNFSIYQDNLLNILNVRDGGLAIHGGIITAFTWGLYFSKKRKMNLLDIFDAGAAGFLIAQSIGRWGNFINQEAHGPQVSRGFLENLKIPNFIIEGMNIGGVYYHPTFLYESLWNFVGFILVVVFRKRIFKKKGDIFCFFVVWYSFARFFIEGLRTDSLMFQDYKVAQIVSVAGIIFGVVFYFKKKGMRIYNENSNNSSSEEPKNIINKETDQSL